MNEERLMQILRGPRISEKSTRMGDVHRQVVFEVAKDAKKPEIKRAVEHLFKVEVHQVQVMNVKGKRKSFGRIRGKRPAWRKAYVTLKPGHDIDFMGAE